MVEVVDQSNRLLVVQSDEAMRWGLAEAIVKDDGELRGFFLADTLVRLPEHWSETLVRFLISWPIRILLIGIFIVALVIEGLHPGVGVPGAVAAGALLLLVGAPGLLGLAEWWEILLVLAGIVLLGVEILVLPGMGVAGVLGALCVIVGLVASFTGSDPTSSAERSALLTATTTTVAGLVLGAILVWVSSRWFRETALMRRAVLSAAVVDAHSAPIRGEVPLPGVGAHGIADTDLRPSGRAQFGEDVFDAQSTGAYVHRGSNVVVVARNGQSLVVEEVAVQNSASGECIDSERTSDQPNERGTQA
jgi:membrane-bound serine protease (ClpP class)